MRAPQRSSCRRSPVGAISSMMCSRIQGKNSSSRVEPNLIPTCRAVRTAWGRRKARTRFMAPPPPWVTMRPHQAAARRVTLSMTPQNSLSSSSVRPSWRYSRHSRKPARISGSRTSAFSVGNTRTCRRSSSSGQRVTSPASSRAAIWRVTLLLSMKMALERASCFTPEFRHTCSSSTLWRLLSPRGRNRSSRYISVQRARIPLFLRYRMSPPPAVGVVVGLRQIRCARND